MKRSAIQWTVFLAIFGVLLANSASQAYAEESDCYNSIGAGVLVGTFGAPLPMLKHIDLADFVATRDAEELILKQARSAARIPRGAQFKAAAMAAAIFAGATAVGVGSAVHCLYQERDHRAISDVIAKPIHSESLAVPAQEVVGAQRIQ